MNIRNFSSAFFMLVSLATSCSNSPVDNVEDGDYCGEDPVYPSIVAYDTLDSMEFFIPESDYLPQYDDWDTILCEGFGYFKWDVSNLDSVVLLQFENTQPYSCLFYAQQGGMKKNFNEMSFNYGNDTNLRNSIYDTYFEIANQIKPKMVPMMLGKTYHLEDISFKSSTWLTDSIGMVSMVVRLIPPRTK